ncbi:uncharacterized protein LOC127220150 [Phodopus roborovskii]|uniref:uncharacterized protein LOC127220150 n=1 Tax=Phodopus roborovskii TaxID=109678 RepID=UPI0021E4A689|nr:uncharacterized protein LOC127220150 [Phodopus roborovskii]
MKEKRKNRLLSDHELNSVLNENPGPLVWAPLQLSPLIRGELEGHMSQKVSTLREQVVPLPVKKSWEILNRFMDVHGVPEQELPNTQLPTFIPQSAEQNTNRSPDIPLFHLHVNIGMNSELSRAEAKMSQSFTSNKQLQSEDDHQVVRYNPLVISMGTPSPRNLGVNIIQEETALLKRDPKHVLELSIEQRVIGHSEKRIQPHKAPVTDVEQPPKTPCSATDSMKVTPLALLQVMNSMGMIPEPHSEVMGSVEFSPQQPNQTETVSITPQPLNQAIESIKGTCPQYQTMESKSMASRQNQVTDNMKVTPVALFHIMDSMGMINELHPHVESVGIAPKPQYQVMKPVRMDTLHNHQAIGSGNMSLGPQHTVMETLNMTLGSQNQATKHIRIAPSPICQNTMKISSTTQPTMDFVHLIPPGQPPITDSRALIQGSQPQAENLTSVSTQPDVLTPTVSVGAIESGSVVPQLPSKVLEPSGMILLPPGQSLHALKMTPVVQVLPPGMTTPLHVVEPPGLPQPVAQVKESLELPSGLQVQVGDSMGMTAQHQGTEFVSLTPGPSHQVMGPLKFTPWHQDLNYSETNPRQSHKITETVGLTSDTWPKVKDSIEVTQLHHQVMESMRTIPEPPDQGTAPIGRIQKHEVTETEVVPLQEMEYLGENTIQQPKDMDSMNLSPELQNVKTEHLIPDPRLQSMKSVDLVPETVKYAPQTSTVVPTDLTPELHQQNMQFEELTPMPPLQSEKSVPSAPTSQLQDMKSGQLTVGPQPQNIQSSGLAPDPQLQNSKSIHLIPCSPSQGMEDVHSALPQELQGDIKMVELTPRPSLEDTKSVNLAPKPYSQNTSSDKITHVSLLEDTKTPLVEGRSRKVDELIPSTHLYAVNSLEVSSDPSYHFPEPEGLVLQHKASEARVTSETCHQVEESVELTQLPLGMTLAPLSQTSESMEMSSPPLQDVLVTRTQIVKEMEEPLESQNAIKGTLDLLPESEVQNLNSGVMVPEPQHPDGKFVHVTLEPCSEVTNPSEITVRPEYEDTETIRLTLPKVDDTQGTIAEPFVEMGSLGLSLDPRVQGEKSESLAQNLKSVEVIDEPSVLVVELTELTTGPKPHIKDVIPGPQLHQIESGQIDTESQLQNEKSVNVIQQSSIGMADPEKIKPEPGLQSLSPKELIEGTQPPSLKSVDLNLAPQKLSVKSGLIPGPQLQNVRFPNFYQGLFLQGENPVNFISGPPHYGVKSDEAISPVPETRSSDFILGSKVPEPQPQPQSQHVTSVEVNVGPCLQNVRFSDQIPEPKHQGFKHIQFIPGIQLQDSLSQGFMPESFSPLSQEPRLEDMKLVLPMEVSEFHSMKLTIPTPEPQYPSVIPQEVNTGLWQQDAKFSELASRPKLQGVKFGEQTPGSLFHGMSSMTPEVSIHDPNLAKITLGPQDTKQTSFNAGPCLQNVKFSDVMPGTQSQGVKTSELNLGPQLECVKIFEMTTQPERQGMKPELIVQESLFNDIKYVTGNQAPSFEEEMSYKVALEPQISNTESGTLASELIRRPQEQGIGSYELIHEQHLEYIKPVEKIAASKQEELMLGPHLGDMKSKESELGKFKSMLSTPGIQAGQKELEELSPGSNLKGLESELLPSRPQLEDRKSGVLTLGQCLERIKSTVVSPSSSQQDGLKSVKLIPGSRIQDLKTVGLACDTWVQDVNTMGSRLEPKKHGESPVTFVPEMLFQGKSTDALQGIKKHGESPVTFVPEVLFQDKSTDVLQGIKPKEPTSQPQTQDKKHLIISCLKPQNPKPVNMAKIQGIQGVKFVGSVSTQQCQEMAPMDLTLEPGQDDQKTVNSAEWKVGLKTQFELEDVLSMGSDQEPKPADIKSTEVSSKVPFKDTPAFELAPEPVVHNVKTKVFQYESQVQSMKPCQLTPGPEMPQMHQVKSLESISESPLQDVKSMALKTESQSGSTKSIQWIPISEFQSGKCIGSNLRLRSQSTRPTELKPSAQWRSMRSSEFTIRPKIQGEKSVGFHPEPQSQQVKTSPLALGLQKTKTCNLTSESQAQGIKTVELNREPQVESVRSIQRLPGPEFHGVKFLGLNRGSPSQGVQPAEQKPSIQLGGVKPSEMTPRPKLQGKKSVDFNLGPQIQYIKTPEASPEPQLQEEENFASTSEPQPQGIKTVELNREPQVGHIRSIQWLPGPEFRGVKFLGLNRGSPSQGVKSTEQKPSIQLGGVKPPEMTIGPKLQGKKSVDFNLGAQEQYTKTPEASPETELHKEKNVTSALEPQSQCVRSVALHHGPQLENTKSVQWIPVSDCQVKKPMLNFKGLQSQDVTAKGLKPLVHLRDSKTSDELTLKPKLQSKQPSGSIQGHQPQRFTAIDLKSELQFRSMKACDPTLRSKINNAKLAFKPKFHLEDMTAPGLNPGIQPQEVKPSGPPPGTQPQAVTSVVFKQESQSSEVKYGVLSQGPQSQNNIELKSAKSSELALQTKSRGMKSEVNSGPQWQSEKCSDLTPETESQNMKCTKSSPSSQLKGKTFTELAMGTKIRSVKLDCKPGLQRQGTKPNSILRTKPQEMRMEDCESSPQLQDLKSSRTIMGIQVQDVKSVDFGPGPHLQDMTSEVITEKRVHGMKSAEIKPTSKLQGKKPDFTPRKMFLGTKSVDLDSGASLQDLKYPELIMSVKLQEVNSMGQHVANIKSSEVVTQIHPQGVKAMNFNSEPQPQNKKLSELAQGKRLQDMGSVEFNQSLKLQGVPVEIKPSKEESVKLNSGPQLQDETCSKPTLGAKLQDGRWMEVSSGPGFQGMMPSEVTSEDSLKKEKPMGFVDQPLWQDVNSFKWTFWKALDKKPLQLELLPQSQDRKLPMLIPELHLQGLNPEAVNPGSELKDVKAEPTNIQTVKDTEINHGTESQVGGFSEQALNSTIYSVGPELKARNQKQDGKSHKSSQKQQLQSIQPIVFSHEPHLQHIKSSELCRKLPDLKSMDFNSEQQLQDVKSSDLSLGTGMQSLEFNPGPQLEEVCAETKLLDETSLQFKHEPRLQGSASCDQSPGPQIHYKNVIASNTGTQNVKSSELHPGPDLQDVKSKVFCFGPHLEIPQGQVLHARIPLSTILKQLCKV